ncbi:pilin [Pseudoxanthomonas wuyuanensis]|uniref:Type IV pilus assembly protein PilA n=1 Tax=Pseudoxanthomonas wuyuanensis TaxID=1073196 RepID=A0A286D824_9GAMM|nr:pilin [Pseudoxanthomonas wuyuanensis]KAF1720127.1 pilus assembly protein PilA [Pseudoxanthomonas wuyuanensis]SOD54810.1 type IV pilus assembly protein PilA [Pseudoxanthomonas wuyuanensis]
MTQWYYADRQRQRFGPVSSAELAAQFQAGRIGLDALVWHEGLSQWQSLGDFAAELGLLETPASAAGSAGPPPVPGAQPQQPPVYAAAPVAKPGMSGGKIALIVAAVLVLPVLAVLGILAAISIPAYNDYSVRAKVAETMAQASPLKAMVTEYRYAEGTCPRNGDADFGEPESYASRYVALARIGEFDDGTCGVELRLHNTGNAQIDGKHVWLAFDADEGDWTCSSEVDDRYLPALCRG